MNRGDCIVKSNKISIRNAKNAITGLVEMVEYMERISKKTFKDFTMCELGSFVGDSAGVFLKRVGHISCVDAWAQGYDDNDKASSMNMVLIEAQFDQLIKDYNNITKYKMTSNEASKIFDEKSLDFVYIDALHTYHGVKTDIKNWLPKVKDGGFIGGHDYASKHFPGVAKAVDEFFRIDARFKDSSWVKRI